ETSHGLRVCPVDWERAAIGPGLIDIAALVAGQWPEEQKEVMAFAYRSDLQRIGADTPDLTGLRRQLCLCRLFLAIQWLGWSSDWRSEERRVGKECRSWWSTDQ